MESVCDVCFSIIDALHCLWRVGCSEQCVTAGQDDTGSSGATGEAADTGTTGGSSTASAGTSAASKGVKKVCDVCEEWYAMIPASVSSVEC